MERNRHMSKIIDIMALYTPDCHRSMPGREIARKLGINHQTALNSLNELVKRKILAFEVRGRNKEYGINLSNSASRILLEMAEQKKALELTENTGIKIVIEEMIPFAETIIVFGSFANKTYNEKSDIDLLVLGKCDMKELIKIKKRHTREINIEAVGFDEFYNYLNKRKALALEVAKNHAVFGNVSRFMNILWKFYQR